MIAKHTNYIKSRGYKQSTTYLYKGQKSIIFSPKIFEIIWNHLDTEQEAQLGYIKGNNNQFFKEKHSLKIADDNDESNANEETNEETNEENNE